MAGAIPVEFHEAEGQFPDVGIGLETRLTSGASTSDTNIPIVPACGDGVPVTYRVRQVASPRIDELHAPSGVARFQRSPDRYGPRKADPIAPHEIPRIATIVDGLKYASTTEIATKPALQTRIISVRFLSDTF